MLTHESFLAGIETYLAQTGMAATTFGREALNDPKFVFDIRDGRSPSLALVERCHAFIRKHPAGQNGR